jgi:hypothetical protein
MFWIWRLPMASPVMSAQRGTPSLSLETIAARCVVRWLRVNIFGACALTAPEKGRQMRLRSSFVLGLLLGPLGLVAQTPVKPVATTGVRNESKAAMDQEKNIEAYIQLMRTDLRNEKAQVTGAVMQLDAEDSAKFWPIYKDFEAELAQVYDGVVGLVEDYAKVYDNLTDSAADPLGTKVLDLEQQRNDVKRKYYKRMKESLGAVLAVRFLQVENQIERLIDLQIASELPVAERSGQ